jgi:Family of unknown function (DUF5681)
MPEIRREKGGKFQKGQSAHPAGRPKGALGKRTREIAERATKEGLAPLEILLKCMHEALAEGKRDDAAKYASMACPYVHPRLQAIEHGSMEGKPMKLEVSWITEPRLHNQLPEAVRDATREPFTPPPKVY